MRIETQRRIDRWVGAGVCRFLSLWDRLRHRRPPLPGSPRNILVILLSEMGSLVLAVPMLRRLRTAYPGATVRLLVFERNRDVRGVLKDVCPVEVLTVRDTSLAAFVVDSLRLLRQMRRLDVDTVIDCELFSRAGSILSFLSGARVRVGFHPFTQEGLYRGGFINRPVLYNPYHHISRQYLHLASAIEGQGRPTVKEPCDPEPLDLPMLSIQKDEIAQARDRLAAGFPEVDLKRMILLYPSGGLLPIRAWPENRYHDLARRLCEHDCTVAVIGPAADSLLASRILDGCASTRSLNLTGYTATLRELVVLFNVADLLVANDGGPAQFAALAPIPTVVLFGPETPELYRPPVDRVRAIYRKLACSPCLTAYNHRRSPCDGVNVCLRRITVDEVPDEALALLGKSGTVPLSG